MQCAERPDNRRCMDCDAPNPTWSSCKLGIFICLNCAGRHRSYGVSISFVRATDLDRWSEEQAGYVLAGGNARFSQFLQQHRITRPVDYQAPDVQDMLDIYRKALQQDSASPEIRAVLEKFKRENGITTRCDGEEVSYKSCSPQDDVSESAPGGTQAQDNSAVGIEIVANHDKVVACGQDAIQSQPELLSEETSKQRPTLDAGLLSRKNTKRFGKVVKLE